MVTYPTIEDVNSASRYMICYWNRFLPSPGTSALKKSYEEFGVVLEQEVVIMKRICERFKELGGFTPELSKQIGWK